VLLYTNIREEAGVDLHAAVGRGRGGMTAERRLEWSYMLLSCLLSLLHLSSSFLSIPPLSSPS
jgi:hypothetical protein